MSQLHTDQITTNGISMRVYRTTPSTIRKTVLLLHGFPGLGYSWRHQWGPLADAGYQVLAPDMRGYGGTDQPQEVGAYDREQTVADVVGLLDHYGVEKAVVSGHDYGAAVGWDLPLWAPERIEALMQLSVPRYAHSDIPPLEMYAQMARDHWVHFHYFEKYGRAEQELNPRAAEFLQRIFHALSGAYHYLQIWQEPNNDADGNQRGYLDVLPDAPALPWPWLTQEEFDVYAAEFARTGFTGGLNWYRAVDLVWRQNKERGFADAPITIPTTFIAGGNDTVVEMFGREGLAAMRGTVTGLRDIHLIDGAGHFVQMEAAEQTTAHYLDFLDQLD